MSIDKSDMNPLLKLIKSFFRFFQPNTVVDPKAKVIPKVEVVVAHYNEDLSWLEEQIDVCRIYSKGGEKNAPKYPYETLENIGREGHTYLRHIIEHYDDLADVTVFLQGRIDDHIDINFDQIIKKAREAKDDHVVTFPWRELELFDHWEGIPWAHYPSWRKWTSMTVKNTEKTPGQYWKQFFPDSEVPYSVGFAPGALFAVTRKTIQRHSKDLYKLIFDEFFQGDMAHVNPETGHFMERFWLAMWNPSEYVCMDKDDKASTERNEQEQLAKGWWHVTPKHKEVDECITPPSITQLPTPPSSDDD